MNRWQLLLAVTRDYGTWVTGIGVLVWEASRPVPSELMVGAALVLINAGAYRHIKAILPGGSDASSSESAPPAPRPGSSSSSPGGHGEG